MSFERAPARWRRTAALSAAACWLFAGGIYLWGFIAGFGVLQVEDACVSGQRLSGAEGAASFDYGYMTEHERLLPLSRPCNQQFDLVPGYVNPLFFTAIIAGVLLFAAFVLLRKQTRS